MPPSGYNVTIQNSTHHPVLDSNRIIGELVIETGGQLVVPPGFQLTVEKSLINDGMLILQSDSSSGTATILENGMQGSGTYVIEQYLTGSGFPNAPNGRMWYLSSPVIDAESNVFNPASASNKLWIYDETTTLYTEITNNTTLLNPVEGYVVRMGSNMAVSYTGSSFNSGDISVSGLTRTGTSNPKRGYHLIGNPYPSYIDWDSAEKQNLSSSIWYRTSNGNSMVFDTYNSMSGIGTGNNGNGDVANIIPPMQAFWIKVDGDGNLGSVTFDNSMRFHHSSDLLKTKSASSNIRFYLSNELNSDEAILVFNDLAGMGFDNWDSEKSMTTTVSVPQIWTREGISDLVINTFNEIYDGMTIPLFFSIKQAGLHRVYADFSNFDLNYTVWIQDLLLGTMHDIKNGPYIFTSNVKNDYNRFVLHFSSVNTGDQIIEAESSFAVYQNENNIMVVLPEEGIIEVFDMTGRLIFRQHASEGENILTLKNKGAFVFRATYEKSTSIRNIFIW